jgi:hypothetical protein
MEIPLDEILKAIHLIEGEWGHDAWIRDLPTMYRAQKDHPADALRCGRIMDEGGE